MRQKTRGNNKHSLSLAPCACVTRTARKDGEITRIARAQWKWKWIFFTSFNGLNNQFDCSLLSQRTLSPLFPEETSGSIVQYPPAQGDARVYNYRTHTHTHESSDNSWRVLTRDVRNIQSIDTTVSIFMSSLQSAVWSQSCWGLRCCLVTLSRQRATIEWWNFYTLTDLLIQLNMLTWCVCFRFTCNQRSCPFTQTLFRITD